jgi:DNA-binding beta-propeller fold protein YncE
VAGFGGAGFGGDGGLGISGQLNYPYGVAVDSSGNVYIADTSNSRIRKITASTGIISTIAGTGAAGFSGDGNAATSAQLYNPYGVAVDSSGNVYIADTNTHRIRKITASSGNISTIAGTGISGNSGDGGLATAAQLYNPYGVAVDSAGSNVYIADTNNHRVRKIFTA